jgi:hypothetical protein
MNFLLSPTVVDLNSFPASLSPLAKTMSARDNRYNNSTQSSAVLMVVHDANIRQLSAGSKTGYDEVYSQ